MSEWISVKDRLPEVGELGMSDRVLVAVEDVEYTPKSLPNGHMDFDEKLLGYKVSSIAVWVVDGYQQYWMNIDLPDNSVKITHWMPLPEAPKL